VKVYVLLLSAVTDCCVAAALLCPADFGGRCLNRITTHVPHFTLDPGGLQGGARAQSL